MATNTSPHIMQLSSLLHNDQRISVREAEILVTCSDGLTIIQAAMKLFISPNTVKRHHTNIRNKFGLRGPHALYDFALALRPELLQWLSGLTAQPNNNTKRTVDSKPATVTRTN